MSLREIIKDYISEQDLVKIKDKIAEVEKLTRGEIRVSLKDHKGYLEEGMSSWDIALQEFYELGMDKTDEKTGVLILVIFRDHEFSIIADEGVNSKMFRDRWEELTEGIRNRFREGRYCEGMIYAIEEMGKVLAREFPVRENDTNELSNEIVIR